MRLILAVVLAAGVLWGGFWGVGYVALNTQVNGWLDGQAGAGISREAVSIAGFPNRFDVTVTGLRVVDPASGWSWQTAFVQVFSMTWKPWHLIATVAPEQVLTDPAGGVWRLNATRLRGSLELRPNTDLALNEAIVEGEGLKLVSAKGQTLAADKLVLAAGADATWQNGLRVGLRASRFWPDAAVVGAVPDLGGVIEDIHLDATLSLSAALDRHLAEAGPVGITAVHLREALVVWGPMRLAASGEVTRGPDGRAEGQIDLVLDHWKRLPDAVIALGLMPANARALVTRALTLLAEGGDSADRLEVALVFKDGRQTLGAIPLGAAPMLP